jgi:hypothetical protein
VSSRSGDPPTSLGDIGESPERLTFQADSAVLLSGDCLSGYAPTHDALGTARVVGARNRYARVGSIRRWLFALRAY